jgi:hypothetical protein
MVRKQLDFADVHHSGVALNRSAFASFCINVNDHTTQANGTFGDGETGGQSRFEAP